MHQVTCTCGKTVYLSDPDEVRACDFCGQKVGAGVAERPDEKVAARRRAAPSEGAAEPPPVDVAPGVRVGILRTLFARLFGLFCLPVLIVALVAGAGYDYYLYPPEKLPCGHEAKERYVFGRLRVPHGCPAMEALRYLDRARRAINEELDGGSDVPPIFLAIKALPGVGNPAAGVPYEFTVEKDLSLAADPSDQESPLPSFYLELDGTVRAERAASRVEAGPGSPVAGRFDERGWFVPAEDERRVEGRKHRKKDGGLE